MTIDEAKKIIKSECYIADLLNLDRTQMVNTALDLAIKALEQQSRDCKTCKHSENGNCAGTEECHECMWESKYEQQPCDVTDINVGDMISRQAVLDIIYFEDKWLFDANGHNANTKIAFSGLESRVKALPSVTPKARWIPCSERLPKAGEYVGDIAKYYLVQNEYGDMLVARYTHSGYWEQIYQLKPYADEIVAWMPLPEPYKAESEEIE